MATFEELIVAANSIFWGIPLLLLIIGTGLLITLVTGAPQIFRLHLAFSRTIASIFEQKSDRKGDIPAFQALSTALSGTLGIGNIAGVSTAIVLGGPGAIFWMWVAALIGMATKYAEAVLAIKYRVTSPDGTMAGGPMYYIERGLRQKWLAIIFAICGVIAAFGTGSMAQANSIALAISSQYPVETNVAVPLFGDISVIALIVGLLLTLSVAAVTLGGIKRIGRVTAVLVPFMALFYVAGGLIVLLLNLSRLPDAVLLIFRYAFSPYALAGGALGYTVAQAVRYGIARSVFSNEAGMGSAPIAYAAARAKSPVDQGLIAMTEVFIDTLFMCTVTALIVLSSGVWDDGLNSTALTIAAFSGTIGIFGQLIVVLSTIFFGYATILGWSYYSEQMMKYLLGYKARRLYQLLFLGAVLLGSVLNVELVWEISDLFNGLMAIPNLIALIALSGVVAAETREHFSGKP